MIEPQLPPPASSPAEVEGPGPVARTRPRSRRWMVFFIVLALLGLAAIIVPWVVNHWLLLHPEQIAEARQRWHDNAPSSYDLDYQVQTKSGEETSTDEYHLEVRDHRPVRVEVNGENIPMHAAARRGVEGLFDQMERRLRADEASGERSYATATFDPSDGHPIRYVHRSRRAHTRVEWNLKLTRRP